MFLTIKLCTYAKLNCLKSSSSSCHAASTDLSDPLLPLFSILHRVQILDQANCISHSTNTLGKGMNPIILPPVMGK